MWKPEFVISLPSRLPFEVLQLLGSSASPLLPRLGWAREGAVTL